MHVLLWAQLVIGLADDRGHAAPDEDGGAADLSRGERVRRCGQVRPPAAPVPEHRRAGPLLGAAARQARPRRQRASLHWCAHSRARRRRFGEREQRTVNSAQCTFRDFILVFVHLLVRLRLLLIAFTVVLYSPYNSHQTLMVCKCFSLILLTDMMHAPGTQSNTPETCWLQCAITLDCHIFLHTNFLD